MGTTLHYQLTIHTVMTQQWNVPLLRYLSRKTAMRIPNQNIARDKEEEFGVITVFILKK